MIFKQKGETLVEVMVAITIMGIVLTAAFVLFDQAISTNINIRHRVTAMSIAQDAVEGIRNIRDTNWMQFSGARRDKWLVYDNDTLSSIGADFYTIEFDSETQQYKLSLQGGSNALFDFNCDLAGDSEYTTVSATFVNDGCGISDLGLPSETNKFKLFKHFPNSGELAYKYTHDDAGGSNPGSLFYRQIYLQPLSPFEADSDTGNDTTVDSFCSTDHCKKSVLKVYVLIYWRDAGEENKLLLETYLFDYYQREKYQ